MPKNLNFGIDYILYYPGRRGEDMFDKIKAYDVYEAILKLKSQKGWYKGDKHPKAKVKVLSVNEIIEVKLEIETKYQDNDPIMPDGNYR